MPAHQPFTRLCQSLAAAKSGRADLHIHSTYSDGLYTPAQIVDLARRSGLSAIAITDHDTQEAIAEARNIAGSNLEVISGVEMTAEHEGREIHLLGYFTRSDEPVLSSALDALQKSRRERFLAMVDRFRERGIAIDPSQAPQAGTLGRRNVAVLLTRAGYVDSVRQAFQRYLADDGPINLPKLRIPLRDATQMIAKACGVSSLAHPPTNMSQADLAEFRKLGVNAIETDHPRNNRSRCRELRQWAQNLGMAITAGSDCHGPDAGKAIGTYSLTAGELAALRALAGSES